MESVLKITEPFYILLLSKSEIQCEFPLTAHLSPDEPHLKCSVVACGWWPWTVTLCVSQNATRKEEWDSCSEDLLN